MFFCLLGVCIYITYQIKKCVYIYVCKYNKKVRACVYICVKVVLINILALQLGLSKQKFLAPPLVVGVLPSYLIWLSIFLSVVYLGLGCKIREIFDMGFLLLTRNANSFTVYSMFSKGVSRNNVIQPLLILWNYPEFYII